MVFMVAAKKAACSITAPLASDQHIFWGIGSAFQSAPLHLGPSKVLLLGLKGTLCQ